MSVEKIEQLEDVYHVEGDKKIIDHKIKRLTAPGENYGSLMLSVDITVQTPSGNEEVNAVAKMVPPNEFIQEIFNTQVTFRNEIGFYKTIVPTLQNFQKEHGVENVIDFSPKCYGSRLNLKNNNEKVDSDAVLLLENLKTRNFQNLERTEGFHLDAAELVLKDLAHLHAVGLALKIQKPEVFEEKVKPYLSQWKVSEKMHGDMMRSINRNMEKVPELQPFHKRIQERFDKFIEIPPPREPFATISHNDCWVNNTMIKLEGGKPVKNKLVDFQILDYGSPGKDVIFFLFSSVKTEVLKQHYDDLIKFYHNIFTSVLQELGCNTEKFSFEAFEKELDFEAKHSQFGHVVFMLFPIFLPKEDGKDISELRADNMDDTEPTDLYKAKLRFVVEEFAKRNWI